VADLRTRGFHRRGRSDALVKELEETCEKFEVAKVRRLERERKVAEKKAAKNLLVTSSAS
jgi:acyl-[acyl-carrier-protein] desaturase